MASPSQRRMASGCSCANSEDVMLFQKTSTKRQPAEAPQWRLALLGFVSVKGSFTGPRLGP